MLENLLDQLPSYLERRASAGRAHLRIRKLAGGTWSLSYVFGDGEEMIYLEGRSLSHLAEEGLGELEERGYG